MHQINKGTLRRVWNAGRVQWGVASYKQSLLPIRLVTLLATVCGISEFSETKSPRNFFTAC